MVIISLHRGKTYPSFPNLWTCSFFSTVVGLLDPVTMERKKKTGPQGGTRKVCFPATRCGILPSGELAHGRPFHPQRHRSPRWTDPGGPSNQPPDSGSNPFPTDWVFGRICSGLTIPFAYFIISSFCIFRPFVI